MRLFSTGLLLWIACCSISANAASNIRNQSLSDVHIRQPSIIKRNAPTDNLKQLLDTTSIIARISNGIALQAGLMDGSIKIEDAVGELLNLGNVKVSDVVKFKLEPVKTVTQKLMSVSMTLDPSVKSLEDAGLEWNELRILSETIEDVSSLPGKDNYFTSLGNYKTNFDLTKFTAANTALQKLIDQLQTIEEDTTTSASSDSLAIETAFMNNFIGLPTLLATIKNKLEAVKTMENSFTTHKVLAEGSDIFNPLQKTIDLVIRNNKVTERSNPNSLGILKTNFNQINELSTSLTQVELELKVLISLVKNRKRPGPAAKKFTGGFPKGVPDLKHLATDVGNSWIQKVSNNEISMTRLANGLHPLLKVKDQLVGVEDKLNPMSAGKMSTSMQFFEQLQSEISQAPLDSSSLVDTFKDYKVCLDKGSKMVEGDYKPTLDTLTEINAVTKEFKGLKDAVHRINIEQHETDMNNFIKFLGFTDIKDQKSAAEVPKVMEKVRSTDDLKKFKELIQGIQKGLKVNAVQLDAKIKQIVKDKNTLSLNGLDKEVEMHKCLQKLKEKSEKLSWVLKLTQKLRSLNTDDLQDVEKAAATIPGVSQGLQAISSIPDNMKKDSKPVTESINKIETPLEVTKSIVQSVSSLRSVNALKDMKTLIEELKNVDKIFQSETEKILEPGVKAEVLKQWGNHKEQIAMLESTIADIDNLKSSLKPNDIKTFEGYGTQLQKLLSALKDVKIDLKSKKEALKTLMKTTTDPKVKSEFEKAVDILEELDTLDLEFSSHKQQFNSAPAAFQKVFDFLVKFSSIEESPESKSDVDLGLILGMSGGAILLFGGLAVAAFLAYKYLKNRVNKKSLKNWILAQEFEKHEDAYRCHEGYLRTAVIQTESAHRWCNPDTALKHLKKDGKPMPIHANIVKSANGKVFYATQAPLEANTKLGHEDTMEDFWHMCVHDGVKNIVMLCNIMESGEKKSAAYFPQKLDETISCGRYELTTIAFAKSFGKIEDIAVRQIQVKDTTGHFGKRVITHYHYLTWKDQKCPDRGEVDSTYVLMKELEKSNKPVVVHCSSGIGRTMAFIGVHVVSESVKKDGEANIGDELTKLKKQRLDAVQTIRQSYWLQIAVMNKLNKDYALGLDEDIARMKKMFYEVSFKDKVPEEFLEERKRIKQLRKEAKEKGESFDIKANSQRVDSDHLGKVILY